MSFTSRVLFPLYVLTLLAILNPPNVSKTPNRMPTELSKPNFSFPLGRFAFGPTTNSELQYGNCFVERILPLTLQFAIVTITRAGVKTTPSAATPFTFLQVNGTNLFREGDFELKIIASGQFSAEVICLFFSFTARIYRLM